MFEFDDVMTCVLGINNWRTFYELNNFDPALLCATLNSKFKTIYDSACYPENYISMERPTRELILRKTVLSPVVMCRSFGTFDLCYLLLTLALI